MCRLICPKCFTYSFVLVSLHSGDHFLQEVAQCFVKCFRKTVGRSMTHGRLVLLEFVFLANLVHELVDELYYVSSDDVVRHTISMDDMIFDEIDDNFILDFP